MSSNSNIINSKSTATTLYDPTLPHIAIKAHLEAVIDAAFRRSLEIAKFETQHLSLLGQEWKERTTAAIALGLSELYIDKETGQKMAQLILKRFKAGKYDTLTTPFSFKESIFQDMRGVCSDKHLILLYSEHSIPEYDPHRSLKMPDEDELTTEQKEYLDSFETKGLDFSKEVESYIIPDTQIGYFKINLFPSLDSSETQVIIDKAMKNIGNAKALIIDLRENVGGSVETVAFVASYLFDQKQLINQVYQRSNDELSSFYAEPEKVNHRFGGRKPIYVLTSDQTFSGGEELAYDLQSATKER